MDASTRARLIRLRLLLEEAQQRARESAIGRHVAVLLLDGACEYAMGLCLGRLGLAPRGDQFHDRYRALSNKLGSRWDSAGWAGVQELHDERNQAQHRGITVDAEELARWSGDAETFARGLIAVAFEVDVHSILLAEAIQDEEVRLHLVASEEALRTGDPTTAFAEAMLAFDTARERWSSQRAEAMGLPRLYATGIMSDHRQDALNWNIERLEDLLEVQPFAFDVGEYVWLRSRRGEVADGHVPTLSVAERSLLFIFYWCLRWEAFSARYTERRWPDPQWVEPPTTEDGIPAIWDVVDVTPEMKRLADAPQTFTVRIQLANVPVPHRDKWASFLFGALAQSVPKNAETELAQDYARVGEDGIVRLFEVPHDRRPDDLLNRIRAAIAMAQQQYSDMVDLERRWEGQYSELLVPYETALKDIRFEGRSLTRAMYGSGRPDAFEVSLPLQIDADDQMLGIDFWHGFVKQGAGADQPVDYREGTLVFKSSIFPEELRGIVERAVAYVEATRTERRAEEQAAEEQRTALEHGLRGSIAHRRQGEPRS